jgi:hypothetical protein
MGAFVSSRGSHSGSGSTNSAVSRWSMMTRSHKQRRLFAIRKPEKANTFRGTFAGQFRNRHSTSQQSDVHNMDE